MHFSRSFFEKNYTVDQRFCGMPWPGGRGPNDCRPILISLLHGITSLQAPTDRAITCNRSAAGQCDNFPLGLLIQAHPSEPNFLMAQSPISHCVSPWSSHKIGFSSATGLPKRPRDAILHDHNSGRPCGQYLQALEKINNIGLARIG